MKLLVQLAGLIASCFIVWPVAVSARLSQQSVAGLFIQACAIALLALLVNVATQLAYSEWAKRESIRGQMPGRSDGWLLASAFAVALGAETSIVALGLGAPRLAATLLCASAAALTLLHLASGARSPTQPAGWRKTLIQVTLVLILVLGLRAGGRFAAGSQSRFDPDPKTRLRPKEFVTALYEPPPGSIGTSGVADRGYPGVILWPEVKTTQKALIAPARSWVPSPLAPVPRSPFSIPFSGQYWMFKPPQMGPPRDSYFRRSSPLALSFSTTDQRPLSMEAVQKLDHALDVACCRAIQLAIENADRYPGTIALELLLIDTQAPGQPVQSLGKRDVLSRPGIKPLDLSAIPVTEVLDFPVPRESMIHQFDAIQVLFHRAFIRIDRSAKISIASFTLEAQ